MYNIIDEDLQTPFQLSDKILSEKKTSNITRKVERKLKVNKLYIKNLNRKNKVKEMMQFAWLNYVDVAWGLDELHPVSAGQQHLELLKAVGNTGLTIIDAMDTLHIMGMELEVQRSLEFLLNEFSIQLNHHSSLFEINIRLLGGILSMYGLRKDSRIISKAVYVGDQIYNILKTQLIANDNVSTEDLHDSCFCISELGSFHMEFAYLSQITGNSSYEDLVVEIRQKIHKMKVKGRPYFNVLDISRLNWCLEISSLGSCGDSFYEYLLKEYIRSNYSDVNSLLMYSEAIEAFRVNNMFTNNNKYKRTVISDGKNDNSMETLACFTGGMFALSSKFIKNGKYWLEMGEKIADTCHDMHTLTFTKLPQERTYLFDSSNNSLNPELIKEDNRYLLRPEIVETYFYLWRITKNQKYREWAAEFMMALNNTQVSHGFSGIVDVTAKNIVYDDHQQSFLLAETFKYLYLIFSNDDVLPLNKWVFNTEAHPFPIIAKSSKDHKV